MLAFCYLGWLRQLLAAIKKLHSEKVGLILLVHVNSAHDQCHTKQHFAIPFQTKCDKVMPFTGPFQLFDFVTCGGLIDCDSDNPSKRYAVCITSTLPRNKDNKGRFFSSLVIFKLLALNQTCIHMQHQKFPKACGMLDQADLRKNKKKNARVSKPAYKNKAIAHAAVTLPTHLQNKTLC